MKRHAFTDSLRRFVETVPAAPDRGYGYILSMVSRFTNETQLKNRLILYKIEVSGYLLCVRLFELFTLALLSFGLCHPAVKDIHHGTFNKWAHV